MDIAIIDPATNEVDNVIVAIDIAHAQKLFPGMICVERKSAVMLEPKAVIVGKNIVRAANVDALVKANAKATLIDIANVQ